MDNSQFLFLRNALDDIYRKLSNVEAEVQALRADVSSLSVRQTTGENTTDGLRAEYEEFKAQWDSESPDVQSLKDNLLKLRASLASLGSLNEALQNAESVGSQQG